MNIFSKLKKVYKRDEGRVIWRILFNNHNLMLIEERDPQKKEVFFTVADMSTCKNVTENLQQGELFWTGVECFIEEYILFHGFAKPDMPFHKGMRLYSVREKQILWEHDDLVFSFLEGNTVWAYKPGFEKKEYIRVDLATGAAAPSPEPVPADIAMRKAEFREVTTRGITAPEPERNEPGGGDMVYPETAENDLYTFRSGYRGETDGMYNQYLQMIRKSDGKLLEEMLINEDTPLIIPDSWFLRNNALYVIKDKRILSVYTM
ncbi:MAG: DUF4905 domain-containing protein [Ignavibacteriales bacterium]|nr:MAG: DUF4905 domain-containing protein [Ignavibacteriales bacterium]